MIFRLRHFRRYLFLVLVLLIASPLHSFAQNRHQNQDSDYQGYYSNKLKSRIDTANSRIRKNLKSYKKDKSIARLDESYDLILRKVEQLDIFLEAATNKLLDLPDYAEFEKLKAQIDKLEVITIRDVELAYSCDQLYEVGQLYVKADKNMAEQCLRDIVEKFTTNESCSRNAKSALKHLK